MNLFLSLKKSKSSGGNNAVNRVANSVFLPSNLAFLKKGPNLKGNLLINGVRAKVGMKLFSCTQRNYCIPYQPKSMLR